METREIIHIYNIFFTPDKNGIVVKHYLSFILALAHEQLNKLKIVSGYLYIALLGNKLSSRRVLSLVSASCLLSLGKFCFEVNCVACYWPRPPQWSEHIRTY